MSKTDVLGKRLLKTQLLERLQAIPIEALDREVSGSLRIDDLTEVQLAVMKLLKVAPRALPVSRVLFLKHFAHWA